MPVAEAHKELRFTRAGQAAVFSVVASVLVMVALVFFLLSPYRADKPELPQPAWGLIPLALAIAGFRVALRCAKHAYLLLTPLGIEIFPFFRPDKGMQLILWSEIAGAEIDSQRLTLHFTAEKTAGIHLSLAPISPPRRELLAAAIEGRFPPAQSDYDSDAPSDP